MAISVMDRNSINQIHCIAANNQLQDRSAIATPKSIGQLLDELDLPDKMLRGDSFLAKQYQERKRITQQKRNETIAMIDSSLAVLDEQLKAGKSKVLVEFLSAMAKFHRYSFSNQLLIQLQRPAATRVAGFNDWKKFGRYVKKGEKGIRILAPVTRKKETKPITKKKRTKNTGGL